MLDSLFGVISELNQMPVRIIQINGHTVAVISGVVTDASGISSFANAVLHLLSPRQSEVMEGRKIVRPLQGLVLLLVCKLKQCHCGAVLQAEERVAEISHSFIRLAPGGHER